LLDARRREEQVAVAPAGFLGRIDADRVEALLDRPVALVGGEDPFPLGDECARGLVQLGVRHGNLPVSLLAVWSSIMAGLQSPQPAGVTQLAEPLLTHAKGAG